MKGKLLFGAAAICGTVGLLAFWNLHLPDPKVTNSVSETATKELQLENSSVQPLAISANIDLNKARIGRSLFMDTRLSKTNTISCHSCHDFNKAGADGRKFAVGVNGSLGDINSPSVFNSALNFKQFWNGRADDLTAQASGPVHNPIEMGSNWPEVIEKLNADKSFEKEFRTVFNGPITSTSIVAAIVEFERALVTLDAPFDRFQKGEHTAITDQQLRGYQKFERYGCIACHQGQNVGGNMFQTMGVVHDYFAERGGSLGSDVGRFAVTKKEQDLHVFKVPSLRNVELTSPYFHDGSEPELNNAIRKMARYQLGRTLPEEDVDDLEAFLKSLTGQRPEILNRTDEYVAAKK